MRQLHDSICKEYLSNDVSELNLSIFNFRVIQSFSANFTSIPLMVIKQSSLINHKFFFRLNLASQVHII